MQYQPRHASSQPVAAQKRPDGVPYGTVRHILGVTLTVLGPAWMLIRDHVLRGFGDRTQNDLENILWAVSSLGLVLALVIFRGAHEIIVRDTAEVRQRLSEWDRVAAIFGTPPPPPDGGVPQLTCIQGGRKAG